MNKQEFLTSLITGLSGLAQEDIEERYHFYSEMIDDRIEDGMSEEEAVAQIGNVEDIVSQIIGEYSFVKLAKQKIKVKRKLSAWEIVLLVLGSPIWLALIISAFAIIISLYASLWAVVVSFWACFVSFVSCSFAGILLCFVYLCTGKTAIGFSMFAAATVLAGLSIFTFYACIWVTKFAVILPKKIVLSMKKGFLKKEEI